MKKILVISVGAVLLLSSCGTYTGSGAYAGGMFGSIIGSAVGGISGGWRGSDVGTLIGMAGGAAVGAAIGAAADKAQAERYEEYRERRQEARERRMQERSEQERDYQYQQDTPQSSDESGFDANNGGDDRLYGFGEDFSSTENTKAPTTLEIRSAPEIRNPRLVDASRDGVLVRGEEARMVFEIYNNSSKPMYRVLPTVAEVTGNKHIHVSQNVMVESILPGKGIRYTATIKADNGLRDGEAVIRIGVMQANKEISSQAREFPITTRKR